MQDGDDAAASVTLKFDPDKDYYKVRPSVAHGLRRSVIDVNTCHVQPHMTPGWYLPSCCQARILLVGEHFKSFLGLLCCLVELLITS